MMKTLFMWGLSAALAGLLGACGGGGSSDAQPAAQTHVFSMSNVASGNEVVDFVQGADGSLGYRARIATGGLGSGGSLPSQSSIAADPSRRQLFVVNAGSNSISLFQLSATGLALVQTVDSGGARPISVAVADRAVYVLNADTSNVTAFARRADGQITGALGTPQPLSGSGSAASQVAIGPDASFVYVVERYTDRIGIYPVAADGSLGPASLRVSEGGEPFAMVFDSQQRLYVAEAAHHQAGQSTVTSYAVSSGDGRLTAISAAVPDHQTAACWIDFSAPHSTLYIANTPSGSISVLRVDGAGRLALVATLSTGGVPLDLLVAGEHLYAVMAGNPMQSFTIQGDGTLLATGVVAGAATPAAGLARLSI